MTAAQKKLGQVILGFIAFAGILSLGIYNLRNNADFWEASFVNCITIAIALFVSYHLVQRQNNRRKQKEILLDLIYKLQAQLTSKDMYDLTGLGKEMITMRNRSITNKISILERKEQVFGLESEVSFVKEHFEEYDMLIGNHIENLDHLLKSQLDLKRPLDLIDGKLTEMAMKLFE